VLKQSLAVALGSAAGGMLRFWLVTWAARVLPHPLPVGTIAVNVIGSAIIGLLAAVTVSDPRALGGYTGHHLLMTGVLGGFTTFSAFSLQTLLLAHEGRWGGALANVVVSVGVCLVAVAFGWSLGTRLR